MNQRFGLHCGPENTKSEAAIDRVWATQQVPDAVDLHDIPVRIGSRMSDWMSGLGGK